MNNKEKLSTSSITKIVITILVIILSIFFVFGLIGRGILVIFKNQGRRVDKMISKVVVTKTFKTEKRLKEIATFKSRVFFYKHVTPAVIILLSSLALYLISISIFLPLNDGNYVSMFDIFFKTIFPWTGQIVYAPPLGIYGWETITNGNSPFVTHIAPNWYIIISLITIILFIVGLCYYLFQVQGYVARKVRIEELMKKMFTANLDNIDLTYFINTSYSTLLNNNDKKVPANLNSQTPQTTNNN